MELQDIDLKEIIERETGEHFNKQGYIRCPFHNEKTPSLSIKFYPDKNKWKFKCFGCDSSGDAIDFIKGFKGVDYEKAREYLGLTRGKTVKELRIEHIENYINWQLNNQSHMKDNKLLGIFEFVNENNEPLYYKAKFMKPDGKKSLSYYHIEEDRVFNNRGIKDEVIYNLYNVIEGIKNDKAIIITEGEKDANLLNFMLKNNGYVATSVKGVKDLSILEDAKLIISGDTGKAGDEYKDYIYCKLFKASKSYKVIKYPYIEDLGANSDVSDWLKNGHTKKDLLNAFNRSLDLKSEYELQQNRGGIYKIAYRGKGEDAEKYKKYITNFRLLEAKRINFTNDGREGIKLVFKSDTNEIITREGAATVFDDLRSFRNFLGTLDLNFKSTKLEDLGEFKEWINKYFALEVDEIHEGCGFIEKDKQLLLVTNDGAIGSNKIYPNIRSNAKESPHIINIEPITKEELQGVRDNILEFTTTDKAICLIGTIINDLAAYQNEAAKEKLHILPIFGESGAGKSTVTEKIIMPIWNYPSGVKEAIGSAKPFSLMKGLSIGNYPKILTEFKPSKISYYMLQTLSDILRNLYDRDTISRGNKSLKVDYYKLTRPVVIEGEESYPNQEKALIERSCIIYLGKKERTEQHTQSMNWLSEHEDILNKFGRSLVDIILNLSTEEYIEIRDKARKNINGLKDRPLSTTLNICCGIEIFNILLKKHNISLIDNYYDHIYSNIKEEVMQGGDEAHSAVESLLILYNEMIEDKRAFNWEEVVKRKIDKMEYIYIKTSEMLNQINEYLKRVGNNDITPLGAKDFRTQAQKSGYLELINKAVKFDGKTLRLDIYNYEALLKLQVEKIAPPLFEDVTEIEPEQIRFGS